MPIKPNAIGFAVPPGNFSSRRGQIPVRPLPPPPTRGGPGRRMASRRRSRGVAWEGAAALLARAPRAGRLAPAARAAIGPPRAGGRPRLAGLPAGGGSLRRWLGRGLGRAAPAAPGLAGAGRRHLLLGGRIPGERRCACAAGDALGTAAGFG